MKFNIDRKDDNLVKVEISASSEELESVKNKVLHKLKSRVKVAGFRDGKVPIEVVEKNIDQQTLQTEFIDEAINTLYIGVLKEERIRPIDQPKVDIKKFVPFTDLEVVLEIPVVGTIELPNYKKISVKKEVTKITKQQINDVVDNLRLRGAEKVEVKRAAKNGDEAVIDFKGVDAKGKAVAGAEGKDYPLSLGSKTFIPGFEEEVVGMKTGEEKTFTVTFPKDYGSKALQNAKVTFTVTLKTVNEVKQPEADDAFAKTVGPFESFEQLTTDIKKQLEHEASHKAERDWEAAIIEEVTAGTKVKIPESLIKEQEESVVREVKQNVVQRGMTFEEYLKQVEMTEEEYNKKEVRPEAERRIKAGLVLSEIADLEGIDVTQEELEARIASLKAQYQDKQMQQQLDQPENQREVMGRLRSEKTIQFLKTSQN